MGVLNRIGKFLAFLSDLIILQIVIGYYCIEAFVKSFFPVKSKSLQGEVILITGSANGIGRQICLRLAKSGAKLVCWDISKRENSALIEELKSLGANATGFEVDVSDLNEVQEIAQQVKEKVGPVTILINNAGIMPCHSFLSHNPREMTRAFEVNVYGPLWLVREFLPGMIERKKGHILTVCSAAGLTGNRNLVVYGATKYGINGAMESLREELRHHPSNPKIVITTVYPTPCNTSFARNKIHTRYPGLIPKMTEPEFVADKIVEGLLKEKTHVYIPHSLLYSVVLLRSLPTKAGNLLKDTIGVYIEPNDDTFKVVGGMSSPSSVPASSNGKKNQKKKH